MFGQAEEKRRRLASVVDGLYHGGHDAIVQRGHQLAKRPEDS